jgi:ubiquitin carboxyl-terminal hydrolase 16/45
LLPYKEVGTTAEGTVESSQNPKFIGPLPAVSPVAENYARSVYGGDGEQDDCFGLGDMFDEPEVTSDANKETSTAGDFDVMAWSSNSADDEVDDSNAPISVEGCLALYTEPELLSESWHCEHCSITIVDPNTNELKEGDETAASDREDSEEMMASGDEKQDDDKVTVSCSKKEDIDEITATDGCSNNVNSAMCCNKGMCTNPLLVDAENTSDGNSPNMGNTTLLEKGEVFTIDTTEQPDSETNQQECRDLNSSAVESTSSSKKSHASVQHNNEHNMDVATEETSAPVSCGDNDSGSCSTTSYKKVESGASAEEVVTSSLPSETQSFLPSFKDNEDGFTRNIGRRKRMKMVGRALRGKENQNKQKEDKTKMVGKANKGKEKQNKPKEDKTKVFRAAMRRILISKAPPVLTITLNRFFHDSHGRFRKLKGHVCFRETLDIRPYMDPRY